MDEKEILKKLKFLSIAVIEKKEGRVPNEQELNPNEKGPLRIIKQLTPVKVSYLVEWKGSYIVKFEAEQDEYGNYKGCFEYQGEQDPFIEERMKKWL